LLSNNAFDSSWVWQRHKLRANEIEKSSFTWNFFCDFLKKQVSSTKFRITTIDQKIKRSFNLLLISKHWKSNDSSSYRIVYELATCCLFCTRIWVRRLLTRIWICSIKKQLKRLFDKWKQSRKSFDKSNKLNKRTN
jgi:hypothetical protein